MERTIVIMKADNPLSTRFDEAFALANRIHRIDVRKGTSIPYASHLLGVCALVLERGGDEDQAIAALLHDTIEDHPDEISIEEISSRLGQRVAEIVAGCTDAWEHPKPPWRARKETYIMHLATASSDTMLVSYCDKLHNAGAILRDYRAVGEEVWKRFNAGPEEILWYYRSLVEAFRARGWDVSELNSVVVELERMRSGGGS